VGFDRDIYRSPIDVYVFVLETDFLSTPSCELEPFLHLTRSVRSD